MELNHPLYHHLTRGLKDCKVGDSTNKFSDIAVCLSAVNDVDLFEHVEDLYG